MTKIPFQTVQNSIDYICNISEESDLEKASTYLFDKQPDLAGFLMEFIEDMSEEAQDLGFMMALILYNSFEEQYKELRAMTEEEVVARFEANEPEMEKYLAMDDDMITALQEKTDESGQPEVLNYMIEELFMSPDLEPALSDNEQTHLFIICKFFTDALHELASESASEMTRH